MKLIQIISLITLFSILVPCFSFAQIEEPQYAQEPEIPTTFFGCYPNDTLSRCTLRILQSVLKVIIVIALCFAAIMLSWAGIIYITAGENEEKRTKAKDRLIYAMLGLVIAFVAWPIVYILSKTVQRGNF